MRTGLNRIAVGVVGAALLLAGCTDPEPSGVPVATSAASAPSSAVPEPATVEPRASAVQTPPSSLPVRATSPVATRPTVPGDPDEPTSNVSASDPVSVVTVTATATGTGADDVPEGSARFGQPFAFPSGLNVNVTAPTVFVPSSGASAPDGVRYVWVSVTLQNSSTAPIELGSIGHDASAGGAEAIRFYDSANRIIRPPENPGQLGPGRAAGYRVAFALQRSGALEVRTAYAWDGQVIHR